VIVHIAPVAQGVQVYNQLKRVVVDLYGFNHAPGVIGVGADGVHLIADQLDHIALNIDHIKRFAGVVDSVFLIGQIIREADGLAGVVIPEGEAAAYFTRGDDHLPQQTVAIPVSVCCAGFTVIPPCTQTVCVILEVPGIHGSKLSAMLPGVVMNTVGKHVADFVTCDGLSVVASQQIAPVGVTVGVGDRINGRTQLAGGISVLRLTQDIACAVIAPGPGLAQLLVVLPNELIGTVVLIGDGVLARADGSNIAVAVVGEGIGCAAYVGRGYLGTGLSGFRGCDNPLLPSSVKNQRFLPPSPGGRHWWGSRSV